MNIRNPVITGVHFFSRCLYKICTPSLCTRMAVSPLGKALTSWIAPEKAAVYTCKYGIKLKLSQQDALVSGIAQMGETNPLETRLLEQTLHPGNTVVEIGCYKDGWLALVASKLVGATGRVICFEPMPDYFRELNENMDLNKPHVIKTEPFAVSNQEGEARFNVEGSASSMVTKFQDAPPTLLVKTVTLDGYLASVGVTQVDCLIVDVEGAEGLVLQGAAHLLKQSAPFILMEVVDQYLQQGGFSAEGIIRELSGYGYTPYIITRKGLQLYQPGQCSETLNMVFKKGS